MIANKQARNNSKQKSRRQEILEGYRTWYILNIFITLSLAVLLIYYAFSIYGLSLSKMSANIFGFVSSPFNLSEVFAKMYSSPIEGYVFNGIFTAAIIALTIVYANLWATSRQIRPELVFWTSIISTYIISAIVWFLTGAPSTGTSIIGFCMVGFLVISGLNDLHSYFNKKKAEQGKFVFVKASLISLMVIVSLFLGFFFYSLGNSVYVHFGGGIMCAILILIFKRNSFMQKRALRPA